MQYPMKVFWLFYSPVWVCRLACRKIVRGTGWNHRRYSLWGIAGALVAALLFPKFGILAPVFSRNIILRSAPLCCADRGLVRTGGRSSASLTSAVDGIDDPAPQRAMRGSAPAPCRYQIDRLTMPASKSNGATSFLPIRSRP